MIAFNVPPFVGPELDYVREAAETNHKISGDGPFTHRCDGWIEERFNAQKALLTTSGTTALEMAAILRSSCPASLSRPRPRPSCSWAPGSCLWTCAPTP